MINAPPQSRFSLSSLMEIDDYERLAQEPEQAYEGHPPFQFKESFAWWERMRWIYNLAVGLVGLAAILLFARRFEMLDLIGLVIYGLFANLFYLLGFWVEMADQHYLRGSIRLYRLRIALFLAGTIGPMLLTFIVTWAFYNPMII